MVAFFLWKKVNVYVKASVFNFFFSHVMCRWVPPPFIIFNSFLHIVLILDIQIASEDTNSYILWLTTIYVNFYLTSTCLSQ